MPLCLTTSFEDADRGGVTVFAQDDQCLVIAIVMLLRVSSHNNSSNKNNNNSHNSNNNSDNNAQAFQQPCCMITGGVRIPLEELLQQPNRELAFPLYDRTKQEAGTIQVPHSLYQSSTIVTLTYISHPCVIIIPANHKSTRNCMM